MSEEGSVYVTVKRTRPGILIDQSDFADLTEIEKLRLEVERLKTVNENMRFLLSFVVDCTNHDSECNISLGFIDTGCDCGVFDWQEKVRELLGGDA